MSNENKVELATTAPEFPAIEAAGASLAGRAAALEIIDDATAGLGGDLVKEISGAENSAEKLRKAIVQPFNEQVKRINLMFNAVTSPLAVAKAVVKAKLSTYITEQTRLRHEREEKERQAREEAALQEAARLDAIGQSATAEKILDTAEQQKATDRAQSEKRGGRVYAAQSTIFTRKAWDFEITAIKEVPSEFLQVDRPGVMRAIRDIATSGNKSPQIPGLRVFQREEISVR